MIDDMRQADPLIRVGVLDNDPLALQMFRGVFQNQKNINVLWLQRVPAMAIQACFSTRSRPDVLVVDMALEGISGLDVCRMVRRVAATVRLIGVTAYRADTYRAEGLAMGMQAVLDKTQMHDLLTQIRHAGESSVIPTVHAVAQKSGIESQRVIRQELDARGLSPRELETLRYFSQGLQSRQIMECLGVGKSTLASYEHRAMEKLGARTRAEAVAVCVERRLFG